jgi:uncharacterized membrane protein
MPKNAGLPLAEAIQFGWRTLRDYPLFVVGTALVSIGVPSLIEWGGDVALSEGGPQFAIGLISAAVSATLTLGLAKIYLCFRDGKKPLFENLFDGIAQFHKYIGASIVVFFAVLMGLILLVVPGLVFLIRLWFLGFVIVDKKAGPLDAIQQSWDISRGHTMDLLLLFITLVGLNLLGLICLGVGLLATVPMSGLALAHIYRTLSPATAASEAPAAAPAA